MSEFTKDLEDYFCKFTFGQFVTLILLELVTLFFVFYLGARYGPDLIGSRTAVAKKMELPSETPKSVDEIVGKPAVEYTFPEMLTDPAPGKAPAKKETSSSGGAIQIKPSGVTAEEFDRKKYSAPQKTVLIPREPEEEKAPPASPVAASDSSTPSGAKGKYAIQVGSYPTSEEATRMIDRWKKKGYAPFMSIGEIPSRGTWYRVRIGSFESREKAANYLETFKRKENISALVVSSQS